MPSTMDFTLNKVIGIYKGESFKLNSTMYKWYVKGMDMVMHFFVLKTFSVSATFITMHYYAEW